MYYYNPNNKKARLFGMPPVRLTLRLLSVLALFSISRWLIYPFNQEFFHHLDLGQALRLYFVGWRFDLVVLAFANLPLVIYYCLPFKFIYNKVLQQIIDVYYIVVNSLLILLNMTDVIYFRFKGRRMTAGFFHAFGDQKQDILPILGQVFADYWFMLVLAILLVLLLVVVTNRTRLHKESTVFTDRWAFQQWMALLVFAALATIACRGGLQKHPVNTTSALRYADSQNVPIVLNAPFNIAKSPSDHLLQELNYFDPELMDFSPIHYSTQANRFLTDSLTYKPNLVFLMLESLGQEMITYYNPDRRYPLTPFLDSLLKESLTFNGRANGRRPEESLPALLSGIPSLMEVDLGASPYSNNKIVGLDVILDSLGYHTAMFQGDNNGGMDFDGPFLQSTLEQINRLPQPFATVIHTFSSQYPYTLPKGFPMPKESCLWSGFEKTVYYSDGALRDFFEEAEKQPWFDSTLFVITADHANTEHYQLEFSNVWGMFSVPIAFFMPSRIQGQPLQEMAQQVDLNLSILSALGVNDTVFSFGRNVFDSLSEPSFIAYINQTYQYSDGHYLVQSDGENTIGVFNIIDDRQLEDNLIDRIQCADLAQKLRKRLQEYNNRMINNQLYIDKQALYEQEKDTIHHQSDLGTDSQEEPAQPN